MVLGPFASTTKVALFETHQAKPRPPGRNPATQNITLTREWGTQVRCVRLPGIFSGKPQDGTSIHNVKLEGQNHKFSMILFFPRLLFVVVVRKGALSFGTQGHLRERGNSHEL
jgi:hypothetical protein